MTSLLTSKILTPTEFRDAVHLLAPTIAVFDCDGTLWSADAGSGFMQWTVETGLVSRETTDWIDARYRAYKRGALSEFDICGHMVQMYQGLPEAEMRQAARQFFRERIEPTLFPDMRALIADLQTRGTEIWAVSSTNNWVIEEGVERFNIPADHVLAACVTVTAGVVTEVLCDVPTDEGKVAALARAGIARPDAVFGNSVHDAAMLSIARQAFPINPSPALAERSAREGWDLFYPAVAPLSATPRELR